MSAIAHLTKQQLYVLQLIAEGYTTKQIASLLHRSQRTIDTHRRQICAALQVPNTHAAITLAFQYHLLHLPKMNVQRVI